MAKSLCVSLCAHYLLAGLLTGTAEAIQIGSGVSLSVEPYHHDPDDIGVNDIADAQCRKVGVDDVAAELPFYLMHRQKLDPIIITGVFDSADPNMWSRLTQMSVLSRVGDHNLTASDFSGHGFHTFHDNISVGSYMNQYGTDEPLYLPSSHLVTKDVLLAVQDLIPNTYSKLAASLFGNDNSLSYVTFGRGHEFVHAHRHAYTLNAQVGGTKGWVLAAFDAYPEFRHARRWPVDHERLQREVCDSFTPAKHARDASGYLHSNATRFCITRPGEVLLFPSNHWHSTCGLDKWNIELVKHR